MKRVAVALLLIIIPIALLVRITVSPGRAIRGMSRLPSGKLKPVVTGGWGFGVVLAPDGTLWVWGDNVKRLGLGDLQRSALQPTLRRLDAGTNWVSVACGIEHTMALQRDGTLWGWGANAHGQLGDGTTNHQTRPVLSKTGKGWRAVSAGTGHTVALKDDGSIWAWGRNDHGQLGDGTTTDRLHPFRIGTDTNWTAIVVGAFHTLALKSDGSLWTWGFLGFDPLPAGRPRYLLTTTKIGNDTNWTAIAAGDYHNLALKHDGSLWAWGANAAQFGFGGPTNAPMRVGTSSNWVAVSGRGGLCLTMRTDGTVWTWQSAFPKQPVSIRPVRLDWRKNWTAFGGGAGFGAAVTSEGEVWTWGEQIGVPNTMPNRLVRFLRRIGIRVPLAARRT